MKKDIVPLVDVEINMLNIRIHAWLNIFRSLLSEFAS